MDAVREAVDRIAVATGFTGVVRVDEPDGSSWSTAHGSASRAFPVPVEPDTRFAVASGTKSFTAVAVMGLVADGRLELAAPARIWLGTDLPLIRDDVTIEHLLAHRSGIGDTLDEAAWSPDQYVLPVPVHRLDGTAAYLPVLDGRPAVFAAGTRFAYCNSGYVVLALIAERAAGTTLAALLRERVFEPAGMASTALTRTDAPPPGTAEGTVEAGGERRSNVLHLPVVGGGDGGVTTRAVDLHRFWSALLGGALLPPEHVALLLRPHSDVPREHRRHGLGFWLHRSSDVVMIEGMDAGISARSVHDPASGRTLTTLSSTADGAWPITAELERRYGLD